ncbi:hypothetical protein CGC57_03755 [Capnocytophaga sputigena]|jgi:hypothetical protein|nr:hypothetical protein CGC57_03755 [Capnocytophaga sputigena]
MQTPRWRELITRVFISFLNMIENQPFVKILFFLIQISLLIQNKILPLPIINERQTKQLLFYG